MAKLIPFILGPLLVRPVLTPTGLQEYFHNYIIFILFCLLWLSVTTLLTKTFKNKISHEWTKRVVLLSSGAVGIVLLEIVRQRFSNFPDIVYLFIALMGVASLRMVAIMRGLKNLELLAGFVLYILVSYIGVIVLWGSLEPVPLLVCIALALSMSAIDIAEFVESTTPPMTLSRRQRSVFGVTLFGGPAIIGSLSVTGVLFPTLSLVTIVILNFSECHNKYLSLAESKLLVRRTSAGVLLFVVFAILLGILFLNFA